MGAAASWGRRWEDGALPAWQVPPPAGRPGERREAPHRPPDTLHS